MTAFNGRQQYFIPKKVGHLGGVVVQPLKHARVTVSSRALAEDAPLVLIVKQLLQQLHSGFAMRPCGDQQAQAIVHFRAQQQHALQHLNLSARGGCNKQLIKAVDKTRKIL